MTLYKEGLLLQMQTLQSADGGPNWSGDQKNGKYDNEKGINFVTERAFCEQFISLEL